MSSTGTCGGLAWVAGVTHREAMSIATVLITGTSGGLGASSLSAAVAKGIADALRPVVLIDLDLDGGGLDVTCGIEHLDGLRWPDLSQLEGKVPPHRLIRALPGPTERKVLSAGPLRAGPSSAESPSQAGRRDALASLSASERVLVVDLPRGRCAIESESAVWDILRPTLWLLLVGTRTRGLADLDAFLTHVDRRGTRGVDAFLIVTGGPHHVSGLDEAITQHTGIPVIGHVPWRPAAARTADRGEWPHSGAQEVVRAVCRRLPEARAA